jgi:hypothetical protein
LYAENDPERRTGVTGRDASRVVVHSRTKHGKSCHPHGWLPAIFSHATALSARHSNVGVYADIEP